MGWDGYKLLKMLKINNFLLGRIVKLDVDGRFRRLPRG